MEKINPPFFFFKLEQKQSTASLSHYPSILARETLGDAAQRCEGAGFLLQLDKVRFYCMLFNFTAIKLILPVAGRL